MIPLYLLNCKKNVIVANKKQYADKFFESILVFGCFFFAKYFSNNRFSFKGITKSRRKYECIKKQKKDRKKRKKYKE